MTCRPRDARTVREQRSRAWRLLAVPCERVRAPIDTPAYRRKGAAAPTENRESSPAWASPSYVANTRLGTVSSPSVSKATSLPSLL